MAQNLNELPAIGIGDDGDPCVARTSANRYHCEKSPSAVMRSTGRREKYLGRKRQWHRD